MAEMKIVVGAVVFLMVVVALVPTATADACTAECYKDCDKGKKEDAPACTATCDGVCRLKAGARAYAAATPAAKAAMTKIFKRDVKVAGEAAAASTPGFVAIQAGCLRECNNNVCRGPGKNACTTRCDGVCFHEAEELSSAASAYANTPPLEKGAVIQAIDKHAGPTNKVEEFAATCIADCSKFCAKDPACVTLCDNGCHARAVSVAFSLATPAEKKAIEEDIQAIKTKPTKTA